MPDSHRPLPDHVTLPLLTLITNQSLDADYRTVAENTRGPARLGRRWTSGVVMVVFGVLVAVSFVSTTKAATVTESSRAALISQITEQRRELAQLQRAAGRYRVLNAGAEDDLAALTVRLDDLRAQQRRLALRAGYSAVRGPGIRIVVQDPETTDPAATVLDEDLAILADGLWSAGAEAVAVNGQRLTAVTAFRNVGPAIYVDLRPIQAPLSPPYVFEAIGDPQSLQARFVDSSHGSEWTSRADSLGFDWTMSDVDELTLPAGRTTTLRHATALEEPPKNEEEP